MDRLKSLMDGLSPPADIAQMRGKRLPWGQRSILSTRGRQDRSLQILEAMERPLIGADPAKDGPWIVEYMGHIKRTRAWAAVVQDDTGLPLYCNWDNYCRERFGRSASWHYKLSPWNDDVTFVKNNIFDVCNKEITATIRKGYDDARTEDAEQATKNRGGNDAATPTAGCKRVVHRGP